jgi:hypothetical protein
MKIIIELRNEDTYGNKIDNTVTSNKIIDYAKTFFNCESIEVKE